MNEATRRIHAAFEAAETSVDLSGLQLTTLPAELSKLTKLRALDLSNNLLVDLPFALADVDGLQTLALDKNRLETLPPVLWDMPSLGQLTASQNRVRELPPQVRRLSSLINLQLAGNAVRSMPDELAALPLRKLKLGGNPLREVPPVIGALRQLEVLHVPRCDIEEIPGFVSALPRLLELDVNNNKLTRIHRTIGDAQHLRRLNISHNPLTTLADELGTLRELRELHASAVSMHEAFPPIFELGQLFRLWLAQNGLKALPARIEQLQELEVLVLRHNRLTCLPPEIGQLRKLSFLAVENNDLGALPAEMKALPALEQLFLHGNSKLAIPPEILGPSTLETPQFGGVTAKASEILAYYSARTIGPRRPLSEAKLLVVGEGDVGKTSLVERLLHGRFSPGTEKTQGIARETWTIGRDSRPIKVNCWDFGGQEVMHATHRFFLTRRSLYIIVLAGRSGEHQGQLHYWLRAVRSYGGNSPIIVVANKADQHSLEININRIRADYAPSDIEFFQVSCRTAEGIPELRARLEELVAGLENVNDEVPELFFAVKVKLENAARERNYLEKSEYLGICSSLGLVDALEQDLLLRFLHELGTVLSFDDPESHYNLNDTHVLNPEWVTEGVYAIINNNALMQAGGVLATTDLEQIFRKPERYPKAKRRFIIDMMRKFELCVDVPDQPGKLLVPELLSVNEPDLNWDESLALNLEYKYTVLPTGLVPRFIVRTFSAVARRTYWRTGVVLDLEGCKALVRGDAALNRVRVSILGPTANRRAALAIVRAQFREIHSTVAGFEPTEYVPLPDRHDVSVEYAHLLLLERQGILEFIPQGASRPYRVSDLLNGIERPEERGAAGTQAIEIAADLVTIHPPPVGTSPASVIPAERHVSAIAPASSSNAPMVLASVVAVGSLMGCAAAYRWAGAGLGFALIATTAVLLVAAIFTYAALIGGTIHGARFERIFRVILGKAGDLPSDRE